MSHSVPGKTCTGCQCFKPLEFFSVHSGQKRDGRRSQCKACIKKINAAYANTEEFRERRRKLSKASPVRAWFRQRALRHRQELTDKYVIQTLLQNTPLKASDLPAELINLKREQLRLQRLLTDLRKQASTKDR